MVPCPLGYLQLCAEVAEMNVSALSIAIGFVLCLTGTACYSTCAIESLLRACLSSTQGFHETSSSGTVTLAKAR